MPGQTAAPPPFDEVGSSDDPYDPELYVSRGLADGIDSAADLSSSHVEQYAEQGYLLVRNLLSTQEVDSSIAAMLDLIDSPPAEFRHIQFEAKARELLETLPKEKKQDLVRKMQSFVDYEPRLKAMAEHPDLLAVVRTLIGEEPVLYKNKALIKPPLLGREKPWHQDHAYWNLPLDAKVVTAWIALDSATTDNGCMHLIPGSHRDGPVVHFRRRDWQICDTDVDKARVVAAPLEPGGCLFFDSLLHHGTPANASPRRRRALQFTYVPASVVRIAPEERLATFGSEGKNVTC